MAGNYRYGYQLSHPAARRGLNTDIAMDDMLDLDDEFNFDEGMDEDLLPDDEVDIITDEADDYEGGEEADELAASIPEDNE